MAKLIQEFSVISRGPPWCRFGILKIRTDQGVNLTLSAVINYCTHFWCRIILLHGNLAPATFLFLPCEAGILSLVVICYVFDSLSPAQSLFYMARVEGSGEVQVGGKRDAGTAEPVRKGHRGSGRNETGANAREEDRGVITLTFLLFLHNFSFSLLGPNPVSIEPRHESASFGANPIAIDQELNEFEGKLSPKDRQPLQFYCVGPRGATKRSGAPRAAGSCESEWSGPEGSTQERSNGKGGEGKKD
ncbi:hypothetical protein B0H13DRAFT_1896722 [Mycena leptocephala]|nr:hypothetical protein B0H13DRAFT_1896722 [Mycena leptocephala]